MNLKSSMQGTKISVDKILKYFSYFSQRIGCDILYKLSPNLHKISKSIFWEKLGDNSQKKSNQLSGKIKRNTNLLPAEFAYRIINVTTTCKVTAEMTKCRLKN